MRKRPPSRSPHADNREICGRPCAGCRRGARAALAKGQLAQPPAPTSDRLRPHHARARWRRTAGQIGDQPINIGLIEPGARQRVAKIGGGISHQIPPRVARHRPEVSRAGCRCFAALADLQAREAYARRALVNPVPARTTDAESISDQSAGSGASASRRKASAAVCQGASAG